jgi:uncharacterized membrane protein
LPLFLVFALLSVILDVDNLMLAQAWLGLRVVYLLGAMLNLYRFKMIRPIIWLPSIVVLFVWVVIYIFKKLIEETFNERVIY